MKRISFSWFYIFIFLIPLMLNSCTTHEESHHDIYTCPMHPSVISEKPSVCPVCNMKLVLKSQDQETVVKDELEDLVPSSSGKITTALPTVKSETIKVKAPGIVTYDPRFVDFIASRVGGRLEKVFLKYPFQYVKQGQKVVEIYSPELITAQREYLYLLKNDPDNTMLITAARKRLELLGVSSDQINTFEKNRQALDKFPVYSRYNGYVLPGEQLPPTITSENNQTSTSSMGGMSSTGLPSEGTSTNSPISEINQLITEGAYVSAGQPLFKIVNAKAKRIELSLLNNYLPVKTGDKVNIQIGNGEFFPGVVDFIQPFYSKNQDFLKIRVYLEKGNDLQFGQLVKSEISFQTKEVMWVPQESVVDLGTEQIVFVKDQDDFVPKVIITGIRTNGQWEVKQGLTKQDIIALNAQFLVDSQSFIKVE